MHPGPEKRAKLNPIKMEHAKKKLQQLGLSITVIEPSTLSFVWKDATVLFYPYTGWHSGKTIKDGRGIENLLKQLK